MALLAGAKVLHTDVVRGSSVVVPPIRVRLVTLAPGAVASYVFGYSDVPTNGQTCPSSDGLEVTPPNAFNHAVVSLQRWGIGVLAAIALGVPLGIALAWLPPLRAVVTPAFELLRYIPPFAWVPIAVLWFGATTTTQAAIVFIAAFPACIINTQLAVAQVDPILTRAARTLGAGSTRTLAKVVLPVAAPTVFTGLRIAFSNGWMAS
jgi:ABC-type nitrate/sulfonate/bicarbonate transport system permease component